MCQPSRCGSTGAKPVKPRRIVEHGASKQSIGEAVWRGLKKGRVLYRRLRKRTPAQSKAVLLKEIVPVLLTLGDTALRVFLGRARFAGGKCALSYPGDLFFLRTLGLTCYALAFDALTILSRADAELCRSGLLEQVTLHNNYSPFPGTRLMLPNGGIHSPRGKASGPFFVVPEFFYTSGAGVVWSGDKGTHRLSPGVLKFLIVLLSEYDEGRYGGVNPATISRFNGQLVTGAILSGWEPTVVATALNELEDLRFVWYNPCTVSRKDGHLIRSGHTASYIDEQNLDVLAIRTE
jgi:hypothetical protein